MAVFPTILVFDSGLGGLTVQREIVRIRPDARMIYVADDAAFPYGAWEAAKLTAHLNDAMEKLIASWRPDLVVIACNTASTLALADLRRHFPDMAFVGTVPAIKPACAASRSRLVSVLGTEVTVAREYTKALIRDFGHGCDVTLVGSKHLASLAEAQLRGEPPTDDAIRAEIAPCFVERNGARTDAIVLACTHYPLLGERLDRLAAWPVKFVDPAPAIARRVVELIGPQTGEPSSQGVFVSTSGKPLPVPDALAAAAWLPQPGTMDGNTSSAPR